MARTVNVKHKKYTGNTWDKIAFLSPSYALHADKITGKTELKIDKTSGKRDPSTSTLACVQPEKKGQGKESRKVEFMLNILHQGRPRGEATNKLFTEKIEGLMLFPIYLISLKTEVTSPELGPIVNLAARER